MSRSIRVTLPLALVLVSFMVFIACTSGPTNSNQTPTPVNANRADTASLAPSGTRPQCDPTANANTRARAMNAHFSDANNANTGDPDIDKQREGAFNIEFVDVGNEVVMKVTGRIASKDQPGAAPPKPSLQQFIMRYEWYLKKGCADRVSFESGSAVKAAGFEQILCDGSQVTCPNGTCANSAGECPRIPRATPTPGEANVNVNTRVSNSNAGGNTNSNSNVNRSSNSNTRSGP